MNQKQRSDEFKGTLKRTESAVEFNREYKAAIFGLRVGDNLYWAIIPRDAGFVQALKERSNSQTYLI